MPGQRCTAYSSILQSSRLLLLEQKMAYIESITIKNITKIIQKETTLKI